MSGGEFFIGLRWRASINDQDPGTLPISWDFNLTAPADPNLFWELSIIYDNFFLYQSIAQGYGSSAQGTGWIAPGEPVTSLEIRLNISGFLTPGTSFHLSVPDQSIDINPSAVPEPSSALLLIPGLGYLAVRARRRKV
jgi:hypothetical protein